MMPSETAVSAVDEKLVLHLAELLGLQLTAEQLPGVTANLRHTAVLAHTMTALALDPTQEAAPTWRP